MNGQDAAVLMSSKALNDIIIAKEQKWRWSSIYPKSRELRNMADSEQILSSVSSSEM